MLPLVTGMETKLIKIRIEQYYQIVKDGKVDNVIERLVSQYEAAKVLIKQNESNQFIFYANDKEYPFVIDGELKVIRITMPAYKALLNARLLPEESFSSVLFRLLTASRTEKPYLLKVAEKDIKLISNFQKYQLAYECDIVPNESDVTEFLRQDTGEILLSFEEKTHPDTIVEECDDEIKQIKDEIRLQQREKEEIDRETAKLEALNEEIHVIHVSEMLSVRINYIVYNVETNDLRPETFEVLDMALNENAYNNNLISNEEDIKEGLKVSIRIPDHTYKGLEESAEKHGINMNITIDRVISGYINIMKQREKEAKKLEKEAKKRKNQKSK
jgi:hypothetical protein